MATLYITEQNSILRKTGDRLILQKNDDILLDVQCHKIDAVLMFGNVQFTTQAVLQLFEHGIEMALLSRTGKLKDQIVSPFTKNIHLRIAQFRKYENAAFRLEISKIILEGKIKNALSILRRFAHNHPTADLQAEIMGIEGIQKTIQSASTLEVLFGIEGAAATEYFQAFGKMVPDEFSFTGRTKRPPEDPVNALLSLTYTMIFNEISSLLDGMGFDPYLGFYHHPSYGRASLAADIMEEFRSPAGERFVLKLINSHILKNDDFYGTSGKGVYLKRDPLKKYFSEYEAFMTAEITTEPDSKTSFRKSYRKQAEKMVRCILDKETYTPYKATV